MNTAHFPVPDFSKNRTYYSLLALFMLALLKFLNVFIESKTIWKGSEKEYGKWKNRENIAGIHNFKACILKEFAY